MNDPNLKSQKDERLFFGVVGVGLCVVAAITIFIFSRLNPELFLRHGHSDAKVTGELVSTNEARSLIDFQLTERNGSRIERADVAGKFLIVNFVHTSCSITCLEVNYRMAELQKQLEKAEDIRLVSLTVDPQSDTPEALAKFAARFEADANRWMFLTGEQPAMYSLIEKSFLGPPDPKLIGFVPGGWASSETIAIVDKQGKIRASFNGMKKESAARIVELIAKLRTEQG
ncbi:MAG: SCO family protein [Verrucomicrobiales bacterium]